MNENIFALNEKQIVIVLKSIWKFNKLFSWFGFFFSEKNSYYAPKLQRIQWVLRAMVLEMVILAIALLGRYKWLYYSSKKIVFNS